MNRESAFTLVELMIVILIIGIGGASFPGGNLPINLPVLRLIFPDGLPSIATSAVIGILMNAIFLIFPANKREKDA